MKKNLRHSGFALTGAAIVWFVVCFVYLLWNFPELAASTTKFLVSLVGGSAIGTFLIARLKAHWRRSSNFSAALTTFLRSEPLLLALLLVFDVLTPAYFLPIYFPRFKILDAQEHVVTQASIQLFRISQTDTVAIPHRRDADGIIRTAIPLSHGDKMLAVLQMGEEGERAVPLAPWKMWDFIYLFSGMPAYPIRPAPPKMVVLTLRSEPAAMVYLKNLQTGVDSLLGETPEQVNGTYGKTMLFRLTAECYEGKEILHTFRVDTTRDIRLQPEAVVVTFSAVHEASGIPVENAIPLTLRSADSEKVADCRTGESIRIRPGTYEVAGQVPYANRKLEIKTSITVNPCQSDTVITLAAILK